VWNDESGFYARVNISLLALGIVQTEPSVESFSPLTTRDLARPRASTTLKIGDAGQGRENSPRFRADTQHPFHWVRCFSAPDGSGLRPSVYLSIAGPSRATIANALTRIHFPTRIFWQEIIPAGPRPSPVYVPCSRSIPPSDSAFGHLLLTSKRTVGQARTTSTRRDLSR